MLIRFYTFPGNSGVNNHGCIVSDTVLVEEIQMTFRLTPLDEPSTVGCVDTLSIAEHEIPILPKAAGIFTVEIGGRRFPSNEPVTFTAKIEVSI